MERRLNYYYAHIDTTDGMCMGVCTSINPHYEESYVEIESLNEDYVFKYYNKADGKWYLDSAFTQLAQGLN